MLMVEYILSSILPKVFVNIFPVESKLDSSFSEYFIIFQYVIGIISVIFIIYKMPHCLWFWNDAIHNLVCCTGHKCQNECSNRKYQKWTYCCLTQLYPKLLEDRFWARWAGAMAAHVPTTWGWFWVHKPNAAHVRPWTKKWAKKTSLDIA